MRSRHAGYAILYALEFADHHTGLYHRAPEDHVTDIQATVQECPCMQQQQLTAFPALKFNSVPQFSVGHLHCTMSSPLANTFSEGRLNDFKQEFPKEQDALPEGEKSPVLGNWYAWSGIFVLWYLISECTSVINDKHVVYFTVSTILSGIQQIFVGRYLKLVLDCMSCRNFIFCKL